MKNHIFHGDWLIKSLCALLVIAAPAAFAQPWVSFDDNTRYMALGDSLSAGYAAKPATQGFVFRLYRMGVVDHLNNTLFCAAAVPGAASGDVLQHQVPQVPLFFKQTGVPYRKVVTLTVGGNDLFLVDDLTDPAKVYQMLVNYAGNLSAILGSLAVMPDVKIYVGNLYDPNLPVPGSGLLIQAMNQVIAGVVQQVSAQIPGRVFLVDLHTAFQGRNGLLLIEKHGAAPDQVHPSDEGYEVMAQAFAGAMGKTR